jgi:ferrochelatase
MTSPLGVLAMAYGTAAGPDDVERYYTDIRGGRPPASDHLRELEARYAAIGNRFPLLEITRRQGAALEHELNEAAPSPGYRVFLGMKHSPPFIDEAVERMRMEGISRAVGLVLAPHWSGMSVETYVDRVEKAVAAGGPRFTFVRSWHDHPGLIDFLADRVRHASDELQPFRGGDVAVIFCAHSLPTRTVEDGSKRCKACDLCPDGCRYVAQLEETAQLVCGRVPAECSTAWQSAGRTSDPWWGPSVQDVIMDLSENGHRGVVVCSAGFVADHLEILYDLDIEARQTAEDAGIAFARTEMPNDHPDFIRVLADVVREHLETGARSEP